MTPSNPFTIVAVAILVYLAATVLHEAAGHAAVCALLGGRVISVTSVDCLCDYRAISRNRIRAVEAGGTLANLALGLVCAAALALYPPAPPVWRYFLFLSAVVNLFLAGGYLMVSPFANFGDWAEFLEGMPGRLVWQEALTAAGLLVSLATLRFGRTQIEYFCGAGDAFRGRQAWLLTALPYVAGGIASCLGALRNPVGMALVATSAAASTFGGTCWLLWIGYFTAKYGPNAAVDPVPIPFSPAWIAVAGVALAGWIAVLGPGIGPRRR